MKDAEKDLLVNLLVSVTKLPRSKQNYILGVADGLLLMSKDFEPEDENGNVITMTRRRKQNVC